jgi:hypothetical protein
LCRFTAFSPLAVAISGAEVLRTNGGKPTFWHWAVPSLPALFLISNKDPWHEEDANNGQQPKEEEQATDQATHGFAAGRARSGVSY